MIEKEIVIPFEENLDINTFEKLLEYLLKELNKSITINTIIFDMSKLKFIKLGGLISFLSLCGAIKEKRLFDGSQGLRIYLDPPTNDVLDYLHWMQFFNISNNYGFIEVDEALQNKDIEYYEKWKSKLELYKNEDDLLKKRQYKPKHFPIYLIPRAVKFHNFESMCARFINDLIDVFEPILIYDLNFPREFIRNFFQSNKELLTNIYDHSNSWGVVGIQVIKKYVVFSYSDIGIGIKNSLEKVIKTENNLENIDDRLAIKEALKKGISSKEISKNDDDNDNMGLGLYIVSEYTKKTKGKMVIRSGEYFYAINAKSKRVNYFPGTQIHIAIPIN